MMALGKASGLAALVMASGLDSVAPGFLRDFAIVVMCAIGAAVGMKNLLLKKISPQDVRRVEDGPTRREFAKLELHVEGLEKELGLAERRIIEEIKVAMRSTAADIKEVATAEYDGRTKIWEELHRQVKDLAERVSRDETHINNLSERVSRTERTTNEPHPATTK